MNYYVALDLGAESGRVMLGSLADGRLQLEEVHRFPTGAMSVAGTLRWDILHFFEEIKTGLRKIAARGIAPASLSTDSWGVDYVYFREGEPLLTMPFHYRDTRTEGPFKCAGEKVLREKIFEETGIQFMAINTLFHFEAQQRQDPAIFAGADRFLNIADYFNARLSGVEAAEESLASTTQLYNPQTHAWSPKLISTLELSASLFPKIVPGATVLGPIQGELANHAAFAQTQVIATCSHDTGAAVAAVPAGGENWAYLSSGTWSLLGAELTSPIVTDAAREAGFTNEVGLGGTIRFLKNIAGLWVLQECRRAWEAAGQSLTYEELTALARDNGPAEAHISLQDARFLSPGDMPDKITAFCRETAQPLPSSPGQFTRTILESLALTYAQTLRQLESLVGRQFEKLHIVGGGSRSHLLNQLASDATGLEVVAGPVEATAIGNVLIQALALGEVESAGHLRRIVEDSFPTRNFFPGSRLPDEVHARFQKLHLHKS
jgi:rhamnulokinase